MSKRGRITSVKPGRGPSLLGGIVSVGAAVFGIVWVVQAQRMFTGLPGAMIPGGAPLFPLFGLVFVVMALVVAAYQFKNALSPKRHSIVDITDDESEPDPLNEVLTARKDTPHDARGRRFCPYCGRPIQGDFSFCPGCGRKLSS